MVDELNACCFEFPLLLEESQPASLLDHLSPGLPFGLLTLCVCETHPGLSEHFFFVFVHIDGIGPCRFGFRVGVDFTRSQATRIVGIVAVFALRLVKETFVLLDALHGRSTNDGRDGPPLRRENLGEM